MRYNKVIVIVIVIAIVVDIVTAKFPPRGSENLKM